MPVVTTVFEFFLLLQSGVNVVYRFRTVQSRCFAHSQNRVLAPLPQRFERLIRFLDRYAVPTGRNAGPRCCLGCCCMPHLRTAMLLCTDMLLCYAVLLCVCVCVYVLMCVFFLLFCGYFGNLFGLKDRKVKVYAGHLRCHFLDFFGAYVL